MHVLESLSAALSLVDATAAFLGHRAAIVFILQTMEAATVNARCHKCIVFRL